jgi:lysylphosphatidylglycerol synthetase-like protein (DUF2156 family)
MRHSIARDGIVAGVLGATAVALWFLGIDTVYGHPLATPTALGRGLLRLLGPPGNEGPWVFILSYTIFHYVAFILAGLIVSIVVYWAQSSPTVLAGAMILFVMFEIGFYGLSSALQESPFLGALGWGAVATGNLIAALVMGTYMWRTHPELKSELEYALNGRE